MSLGPGLTIVEAVAEVIQARRLANLTQQELADKMNTTQAVIARMEGGSLPSMRTSVTRYLLAL